MSNLNACSCCEGLSKETPLQVYNRPGLSAISYRIGDHEEFKKSLLNSLSTSGHKVLTELTTRDNDDFTIALLDAWATVSDVLTFYQERIANESYLSTAREQLSILELARLIGYELRPGVAASTFLAFNLDENSLIAGQIAAAGRTPVKIELPSITIESGTRVQSIPEKDEDPQTYETIESIEARADWNAIRPRLQQIPKNLNTSDLIIVEGIANNLKTGDVLLLNGQKLKKVFKVTIDNESQKTWICLSAEATLPDFTEQNTFIPNGNPDDFKERINLDKSLVQDIMAKTWLEKDLSTLIEAKGWSAFDLKESIESILKESLREEGKLMVFRQKAAVFGYNAAKQTSYDANGVPKSPSVWPDWPLSEAQDSILLDTTYEDILPGSKVAIQLRNDSLSQAITYTVEDVSTRNRTKYGISAQATKLVISPSRKWWEKPSKKEETKAASDELLIGVQKEVEVVVQAEPISRSAAANSMGEEFFLKEDLGETAFIAIDEMEIRTVNVHVQSEELVLNGLPIANAITGNTVSLSGFYLGLKKGQHIILSGERQDLPGTYSSEVRVLEEVYIHKGISVLVFEKNLAHTYIRDSVTINANVAAATHGETVKEVLGSGNAAQSFQKFVLKQKPLTFTSAATPSGTESTLEVRVNDILWREVPSLYARGPDEHIYITRQDDQAQTTVIFGDGITGARLPSGEQNITATYRKGIGTGGLLKANQLSQLISRPLGVKTVNNPTPTNGAQDREHLADARKNANLTIFTLGRIISLQDYEDFARAFAGITKSLATWTWCRRRRCVFLTVAGYNGAAVETDSLLYSNLINAIQEASIPGVSVTVKSYQPKFFRLSANIKTHPDYLTEKVFTAARNSLREHFSFEARQFGQAVALSEVYAVIQKVEGVVAVDIDQLYLSNETTSTTRDRLIASIPKPGLSEILPAELLILDTGPIELNEML